MLPTTGDNGARLAAVLPTGLAALARSNGHDAAEVLCEAFGAGRGGDQYSDAERIAAYAVDPLRLPAVRSLIVIVVDGLGHANLRESAGHARTLSQLTNRRIETVVPSTTAAALTTITTGRLPGEHGLVGYQIRHPELGLLRPLNDWEGLAEPAMWQRSRPLFHLARMLGVEPFAIGRPAHRDSGLTRSILAGAEYVSAQTMRDRFAEASRLIRTHESRLLYLYIDELDRIGHREGTNSSKWVRSLEQLDESLADLLRTLPADVGVILTADHGMVNADEEHQIEMSAAALDGIEAVGGEPRFRSFYLADGATAAAVVLRLQQYFGKTAWVTTRDVAVNDGKFGVISEEVSNRMGEVIAVARGRYALNTPGAFAASSSMVGQHGGLSDEERGVPLILAGAFEQSGVVKSLTAAAGLVTQHSALGPGSNPFA